MSTTVRIYPESGDAYILKNADVWAIIHNAATGTSITTTETGYCMSRGDGGGSYTITRVFQHFNVSTIPAGMTITDLKLALYGGAVDPNARTYKPYNSTAETSLTTADYDQGGTTAYSDTVISNTTWTNGGYNIWTANAAGLAALSTAISGASLFKICYRNVEYDAADSQPPDGNIYIEYKQSSTAGTGSDPYIEATYETASATPSIKPSPGGGVAGGGAMMF